MMDIDVHNRDGLHMQTRHQLACSRSQRMVQGGLNRTDCGIGRPGTLVVEWRGVDGLDTLRGRMGGPGVGPASRLLEIFNFTPDT